MSVDHQWSCRQPHDDMQRTAFAAGTTTIEGGPLLIGENVAIVRSHRLEVLAAKGERQSAIAVGQQTEVADLDEAGRQHVQQETTDELVRGEAHDAGAPAATIVLVGERDFVDADGARSLELAIAVRWV